MSVDMSRLTLILSVLDALDAKSFLEIGTGPGDVHNVVRVDRKVGVDPFNVCADTVLKMTSDEFFAQNKDKFDLIFIDGDHSAEQSSKDFYNAVEALNECGVILMHDIDQLDDPRNRGEVYITWQKIKNDERFETTELFMATDEDYIGMVRIKPRVNGALKMD